MYLLYGVQASWLVPHAAYEYVDCKVHQCHGHKTIFTIHMHAIVPFSLPPEAISPSAPVSWNVFCASVSCCCDADTECPGRMCGPISASETVERGTFICPNAAAIEEDETETCNQESI